MNTEQLRKWFMAEKRDLPWRNTGDPYAIWISEVMLQQTQVSVVISYYQRWMEQFPTVYALANASLDAVIKCWEGLGYYSRARNLHAGAQYVVEHFNGRLPDTEEQLAKIKGLGPYTIGAILSFAFHQKKAAVDGNVMRVLARYFQIEEDICQTPTIKKLRLLAEQILPDREPWVISEGLIELGATICQRKAKCSLCPLKADCKSFSSGMVDRLPIKNKKIKTEYLYRAVFVLQNDHHYLVKKGKKGEIMSDLYEFPFFEVDQKGISIKKFSEKIRKEFEMEVKEIHSLMSVTHGFTRYQARLDPVVFHCKNRIDIEDMEWLSLNELKEKPFSSGHRRVLFQLFDSLQPV
jgi:A/G-specific adenine glycosylase